MAAIPDSTKTSLRQRLTAHAREHWPGIPRITVHFHGTFAYIGAIVDHSESPDTEIKRFRLNALDLAASLYLPETGRTSRETTSRVGPGCR